MLVVFRASGQDWARFVETLRAHSPEVEAAGCQRIEEQKPAADPGTLRC